MLAQLVEWVNKIKLGEAPKILNDNRNDIKRCPMCNHNVEDRTIAIYTELANQLYAIYRWCGENRRHEFKMSDVRHFLDKNSYARFNDLIQCSNGILYRPQDDMGMLLKRGHYGMHMARAKEFFQGKRSIHMQISMNQITGKWTVLREALVHELPSLQGMLTKEGVYDYERII